MDRQQLQRTLDSTLSIVMGGGAGSRLFPLTKDRSKPAVPLGGKYRLVDIPISNCLNSGLSRVYVLTQFNSTSLHRHINASYRFDHFGEKFVEILAAQQTPSGSEWYQGTADAVRQNMRYFMRPKNEYFLILSGDQLYQMDFTDVMTKHIESGADLTIATLPVEREDAKGFGIMHTDSEGKITRFVEKPQEDALLEELKMPADLLKANGIDENAERFQASMGIYVFNRKVMEDALDNDFVDFGKHIIPTIIENQNVHSYTFQGYWEDIGTIKAFFDANLDLTKIVPEYDFFADRNRIYTHPRLLPASKINAAMIKEAIVSDGCIITDATIERAIIGVRSLIENGTTIKDAIIMGADYYETDKPASDSAAPPIGIGRNCRIRQAIIDKNARIGDNVVIDPEGKPENVDGENFYIRDGIVVVPKGAVIPSGTVI
ncbi:MAG: glucose-1-phosphate adenylyltransferase [Verrucomicrobiales bacterium]|jgi:glucose-1-phosphate adenylyltransferase